MNLEAAVNDQVEAMDFVEPNNRRAVWLEGRLDDALLARVRPEIADLCRSSEPITVFLNSAGGKPEVQRALLKTLRASGAALITVAAPKAASAAANLLSAGDFAIAQNGSALLWHGGRWPLADLEDSEVGLVLARTLPTFREMSAAELAASCTRRFMAIVGAHRPLFATEKADPSLELRKFQLMLGEKLSEAGRKVLDRAIGLDDGFNAVLREFEKRLRRGRTVTPARMRKLMLYSAIDLVHGREEGEVGWDGGLGKIADHFFSLNSYFDFPRLCEWIASRSSSQPPDVEADYLLRFRQFFLSVCRALQQCENHLTPADALWLGLVDSLRDGSVSEHPGCPWCSRDFDSWPAAKVHVKNCADAPRPRWAENRKRRTAPREA